MHMTFGSRILFSGGLDLEIWLRIWLIVVSIPAKLPTDEQHPAVKSRREAELKERRALYEWGHDEVYSDLPGYVKASGVDNLPRDVQFTDEAACDLHRARNKALINLGLVKLFNLFDQWDDFDDYRKVLWVGTLYNKPRDILTSRCGNNGPFRYDEPMILMT